MALELNGTTGVSLVQDGVVTAADLASTLDLTGKTVTLPAGTGGKVLQVVSAESDTTTSTTSTSYIDTTLEATITPTSASSTILVIVQCALRQTTSASNGSGAEARVYRGVTAIGKIALSQTREITGASDPDNTQGGGSLVVNDSPSTTSATTYKVRIRTQNSVCTALLNYGSSGSTITLMEIAG